MEYDSATTKEQSNAICSNMDATGEHHTKWSKSEKRQITWYHLHVKSGIQLKWAYLQSRNRPTNIEERFVVAKGRQEEERRTGNFKLVQFSSVQSLSCVWLCDPVNRSTPGLPVHHQLPEFTQTHIHRVGDAIQPSHPLSSPSPPAPNPSQHQSLFQWINSLHEVANVLELQL